jgi:predicted hotdog family 3-hydroxylacyl-ACP dehydratase
MSRFAGPITQLVPHRAGMLLIDRVVFDDAEQVMVEATVRRDGLFVDEQGLPAWVGIELMAQTVASWAGLRALEQRRPVDLGFLLGTRRFECTTPSFEVGSRLEIEAKQEMVGDNGLAVFACVIRCKGEVVARALLNAFQPPDVDQYLEGAVHG